MPELTVVRITYRIWPSGLQSGEWVTSIADRG